MAQFEVFRAEDGAILLDCQSTLLDHLNTRFVVPLIAEGKGPLPIKWLNPAFTIGAETLIMYTQFSASIPVKTLGSRIASLASERDAIVRALDTIWTGF